MPINFNNSPYWDDFSLNNNYYQDLFKPGVPVQARELNELQSILRSQFQKFGDNIFQNGSMVKPGQITVDLQYNYVKLVDLNQAEQNLIDPTINLSNTKIILQGQVSGVSAQVLQVITAQGSDPNTLYVKYLNSGTDGKTKTFSPSEALNYIEPNSTIINSLVSVAAGSTAIGLASAASIAQGVYYIYGMFVDVESQSIILDKYDNTPSFRVGLTIQENIVTAQENPTLDSNAQGTTNFSAPGADRYQVILILDKIDLDSTQDSTFVELLRLDNGVLISLVDQTQYSIIGDAIAKEIYDTNGNFLINPWKLDIREDLNDGTNNGLLTLIQGGDAAKLAIGLGPGKGMVKGREYKTISTQYIPLEKARDTAAVTNSVTNAFLGNYILIDKLFNIPYIEDFGTIDLRDTKISTDGTAAGSKIGSARIRSVEFNSGNISNGSTTSPYPVFNLYVFDVSLNSGHTLDDVLSIYQAGSPACTSNVLTQVLIRNPIGTFSPNDTITDGTNTEIVVSWDSINSLLTLQPSSAVTIPANTAITSSGSASGTLVTRTKIFGTQNLPSIWGLPQSNIETVRGGDLETDPLNLTTYTVREVFTTTYSGTSVPFNLTGTPNTQFVPWNPIDFLLWISGTGYENLGSLTIDQTNPLIISISGLPSGSSTQLRLQADVIKTVGAEKTKTLNTTTFLQAPVSSVIPTTISLGKCDIFQLVSVKEATSGNDITSRYILDNGQRDTHYTLGSISLGLGEPDSTDSTGVNVTFSYFTHGNGDYFDVNSYTNFNGDADTWYSEVPSYTATSGKIYQLRDSIDFRPRIDETTMSPYTFTSVGQLIKPNSTITTDFSYYLPRIDKIYIDDKGNFQIALGNSAINPMPPADPNNGMVLYVLQLGAYTYSVGDVNFTFIPNKRYRMVDIGKLEGRISNLEYYTALNLLEQSVKSLNIIDATTGLNRFQNGFIVDPYTGFNVSDVNNVDFNCSIDSNAGICRPSFNSQGLDLVFDPFFSSANFEYQTLKPNNRLLSVPYTELSFANQPYATTVENVNPFAIYNWVGNLTLTPDNDYWKDTTELPALLVTNDAAYNNFLATKKEAVIGTMWNEWVTDWAGQPTTSVVQGSVAASGDQGQAGVADGSTAYNVETISTTTQQIGQTRTGTSTTVSANVVSTTINNNVVNVAYVPYIRPRWIRFDVTGLKPNTVFYVFFDGTAVSQYCKPNTTPIIGLNPLDPTTVTETDTITVAQRILMSDGIGSLSGWLQVPDPSILPLKTGSRIVTVTDDINNSEVATSFAQGIYAASGLLESDQQTITSTVEPVVKVQNVTQSQVITQTSSSIQEQFFQAGTGPYVDPLAQSFLVTGFTGGIFVTSVDIFFFTKDANIPVAVEIRQMLNGTPTQTVVPFSHCSLAPSAINTTTDASVATNFSFQCPVYLQNNQEYCVTIISDSNNYQVFTAILGQQVINSDRIVSQQPFSGVLFESKNASTWTPNQLETLKFNLYRAKFSTTTTATVNLENVELPDLILSNLTLQTTNSSAMVRILQPNHGFAIGDFVTIGLPVAETTALSGAGNTYNGIHANELVDPTNVISGYAYSRNPGHTQNYFTITSVEMDTFTINVTELGGTHTATATGITGPEGVSISGMITYDVLYPLIQSLQFSNTTLNWSIRTESGKSIDGSQTAGVKDSSFSNISVNQNIFFNSPRRISGPVNETPSTSGSTNFQRKSLIIEGQLSTIVDNLSPVIDVGRTGAILISNRCDFPTSGNRSGRFTAETAASGCTALARDIIVPVTLKTVGNSLQVSITCMIPPESEVDVYYRELPPYTNSDIESLTWTQMSPLVGSTTGFAQSPTDFKDYTWAANDVGDYVSFQIKAVMRTTNTCQVPLLQSFRGISLST